MNGSKETNGVLQYGHGASDTAIPRSRYWHG